MKEEHEAMHRKIDALLTEAKSKIETEPIKARQLITIAFNQIILGYRKLKTETK